jgi:predicted PurR-regulated permease PerM
MDFIKTKNVILLISLAAVVISLAFIIKPIFFPIFWAAVIASLFYPLYKKVHKLLGNANLSATLILILIVLIILFFFTLLSGLLLKESIGLYSNIGNRSEQIQTSLRAAADWLKNQTIVSDFSFNADFWAQKISDISSAVSGYIIETIKNIAQNSFAFILMCIVSLYSLYFFLRDGDKILKKVMFLLPLGNTNELKFYDKFTSTARAILKGSLIIGLTQGAIGTLLFYITGIEGALIWGLIMVGLSMLGVGYLIWFPAAIIMFALGNIWQAIVIFAVGALVISTIDNFLKPILVGRDISMHPLLIFISTLGGFLVFNISGIIIGPMIMAFFQSFWQMYEELYHNELENN